MVIWISHLLVAEFIAFSIFMWGNAYLETISTQAPPAQWEEKKGGGEKEASNGVVVMSALLVSKKWSLTLKNFKIA